MKFIKKKDGKPKNKENSSKKTMVIIAVVCMFISGAFLAMSTQLSKASEKTDVVTVKSQVNRGDKVTSENLVMTQVQSSAVQNGNATSPDQIAGMKAMVDLKPGAPVYFNDVSGSSSDSPLAQKVENGKLAVEFEGAPARILSPFLAAGDKVSVFSTQDGKSALYKGIKVLDKVGGEKDGYTKLVLELDEEQAARLVGISDKLYFAGEPTDVSKGVNGVEKVK